NLSRNMGGDIGIAFVTTFAARRFSFHQNRLVTHLAATRPSVFARLHGMEQRFIAQGSSASTAARQALGALYGTVLRQAQSLAFLDAIWILAVVTGLMVPLIFLMKAPPKGSHAP